MQTTECVSDAVKTTRLLQLVKEHRIEAMIVTILLYSTGLLEKAWSYGSGVCV
jgi:hypothetical protein